MPRPTKHEETRMPKKSLREEVKDLRRQLVSLQERLETIEEIEEEHPARVMTYIEGFDDLIGGGIPKGHVCLLSGPSGTMKTTIALNMLCKNSTNGLKALYVTLEETKKSLIGTTEFLCADFDPDFIVDIGRLRTEHEEVEETGNWIEVLKAFISKRKRYRRIELLAIDSLTALYALADLEHPHREMFRLFAFLRDLDITTIFISDLAADSRFPNQEDSIADGAIHVDYLQGSDGSVVITIRCVKLRHSEHSMDYHRLSFKNGEFSIGPLPNNSL